MTAEIDFLPSSYCEAGVHRRWFTLRAVAVSVCFGALAVAALYQQHLRLQAKWQLAEVTPDYENSLTAQKHLADLQARMDKAEKEAELGVYLEHPWPRTRILSTLVEPLAPTIQLETLSVTREHGPPKAPDVAAHGPKGAADDKQKIDPAQHDLQALRSEWDDSRLVVTLTGITSDPPAVQRYLDQLARTPLFTKVDLSSVERIAGDAAEQMRFTARVTVRPSYGQPHGPEPILPDSSASASVR